ncbi:MAG: chitobiase/beta-hexosaminidase C-terminal domain-containing protein [Lachnospiraceae bacterium]|nr:chitobiase/beta-hexosaminidase C-terminal domain-containing protein [Lachnospiraceae bacterium]
MKCPKCGTEIIEGYLYCQNCGEEIRIVPDYEPELFDELSESISSLGELKGLSPSEREHVEQLFVTTKEIKARRDLTIEQEQKKESSTNVKLALIIGAGIFFAVLFLVAIIRFNRYFDFDRQYANALTLHDKGQYEKSLSVARHALNLNQAEDKTKLLIADDYYALDKYDESNAVLFGMLEKDAGSDAALTIYDKIIANYKATKDYAAIVELLNNAESDELRERYRIYFADEPGFSEASGAYPADFNLVLSSDAPGQIFYTTDGSEPGADALLYEQPIHIGEGETTVTAVFVNEYGIRSEPCARFYSVEFKEAAAPVLMTESGSYTIPRLITVDFPENYSVYYSVDGEDPTQDSPVYERPLDMPLGASELRFAACDSHDNWSEVVTGTYTLNMECFIDLNTALEALKIQLMSKGENSLLNEYRCSYGYGNGESSFYLIDEYAYSGSETGRRFMVDTKTGAMFEAKWNNSKQDYETVAF